MPRHTVHRCLCTHLGQSFTVADRRLGACVKFCCALLFVCVLLCSFAKDGASHYAVSAEVAAQRPLRDELAAPELAHPADVAEARERRDLIIAWDAGREFAITDDPALIVSAWPSDEITVHDVHKALEQSDGRSSRIDWPAAARLT
eukprot:CAMPEP_0119083038 /NCGR_PEP_ID=MMETSP1178-20130426/124089_1 /TAXON_ID=33656 /ORGANISM="unid sp, Strain CCMP2000" /LENGTH=145 /DNA_ID=CAMNT_0007065863 /DNA_START=58 /DNA_END=492 /DNA_ORIENTATION=+